MPRQIAEYYARDRTWKPITELPVRKSSDSWRLSPGASLRAIRKMYKELTW